MVLGAYEKYVFGPRREAQKRAEEAEKRAEETKKWSTTITLAALRQLFWPVGVRCNCRL